MNNNGDRTQTQVFYVGYDELFRLGVKSLIRSDTNRNSADVLVFVDDAPPNLFRHARNKDVLILDIDRFHLTRKCPTRLRLKQDSEQNGDMLLRKRLNWIRGEFSKKNALDEFVSKAVQQHGLRVLIVSNAFFDYQLSLFKAGAIGFLLKKEMTGNKLIEAINKVSSGEPTLCSEAEKWIDPLTSNSRLNTLSKKQRRVLSLLGEGLSAQDITELLGLARPTVETHQANIISRLNVRSVADLRRVSAVLNKVKRTV